MQLTYTEPQKERLDRFLQRAFPRITRSQLKKFILEHEILVNGKRATVHHWLKTGDQIEGPDPTETIPAQRNSAPLLEPKVIFENDDLLVVDKPAGLLVHPTERLETNTLADWLRARMPFIANVGDDPMRPGIVHRLDKDVAGLTVIAKNQETFAHLKSLFQERTIVKKYYALVHGVIIGSEGEIATPLRRSKLLGRMVADSANAEGREALTNYSVIERFQKYTLLDVQIKTGRTHQIRAHFFSIGHSIVGDRLYRTRDLKKKRHSDPALQPLLFAYYLRFTDQHGQEHEFSATMPKHFTDVLESLRHPENAPASPSD